MQFAPDGRLFLCEQGGRLWVIRPGEAQPTEFVQIDVTSSGSAGLLGVAFDPAFATNQFVYVYYTTQTTPRHNRISRFTADGDVAVPGSEVVLFDLDDQSQGGHHGGALHFGLDGKLYVAVGENHVGEFSQALDNLFGKILRLNSDGTIPEDNPFFGVATGKNRAIWALGLRNPFTFAVQPATGRMFINDVGQSTWEEINEGAAGANYGWPESEGPTTDPRFTSPIHAYGHGAGETTGCAITGGTFYPPDAPQFPAEYLGRYFFADFCSGWIRTLDPSAPEVATTFATGIAGPVDLEVGSDGSLYYLAHQSGAVYRVLVVPDGHTVLTVSVPGSGTGFVTSDLGEIGCPLLCMDIFPTGTVVSLTAVPDVDATFAGWSGDCAGTSSCVVTMDVPRSVAATFALLGPDLAITTFTSPIARSSPGSSYVVSDTTTNQGTASAGSSATRFYLSLDLLKSAGDTRLNGVRVNPSLEPDSSSAGPTTVTVPASTPPGMYWQLACADDKRVVAELDEANNCLAAAGRIEIVLPDLATTAVSDPPALVAPGFKFAATDSVQNLSSVSAASSTTRYYLSPDATKDPGDVLMTGNRNVSMLPAGGGSTGTKQVVVPAATATGAYRLLACADDLSKVRESEETNNCAASAALVQVALPDLVTVVVSGQPATVVPGQKLVVNDTVMNDGAGPAVASSTRYFLSVDPARDAGDILMTGTRSIAALGPGASSAGSKQVTVPATTPPGTYYLLACADDSQKVLEDDEANNCRASVAVLTIQPSAWCQPSEPTGQRKGSQ
jgi:glucose/arabinose dehydrogenase